MKTFLFLSLFMFPLLRMASARELGVHEAPAERPLQNASGFTFGESLSLVLTDPNLKESKKIEEKHPWIRLFENGKDTLQRDLQSTLDFLKLARSVGRKKIRPDDDRAPGLILTFRGLVLTPNLDKKSYTLKLVGEFNSTEFQLDETQMKSLFDGKVTTLNLASESSRSTGPTRYIINTNLKLRMSLENQTLKIHSLEGGGSITTVSFTSKETYKSPAISLGDPKGLGVLYEGKPGELPKLTIIK